MITQFDRVSRRSAGMNASGKAFSLLLDSLQIIQDKIR